MSNDCKECNIIRQLRQRRISYNQLSDDEKKIYWDSFRKLAKLPQDMPENANPRGVDSTIE